MIKIGINARALQARPTGVAKYILNSILNLKTANGKNDNDYMLFFGSDRPVPEAILNAGFKYDIPKMSTHNQILKLLWAQAYLPFATRRHKLDLFHEYSLVSPAVKRCRTVLTVYDIAPLYLPDCYTYATRLYLKSLLPRSIRQADRIIAISKNSKDDLIRHFKVTPDKIEVVHAGVDETFRPIHDRCELERIKKIYNIRGDFILAVSLISPRKNLTRLIKAFKVLKDQKKTDGQLVIVGRKAWLYEEVFREAVSSGLEKDIVFCGHIPDEHLVCMYSAASVFAYPSLYEGFGLPILEAMACGAPVVASNISSIPEVCGQAALLVDPYSIEELARALDSVINNPGLRQDLIRKGLEQASRFSWKKTSEDTLAVYEKAMSR